MKMGDATAIFSIFAPCLYVRRSTAVGISE